MNNELQTLLAILPPTWDIELTDDGTDRLTEFCLDVGRPLEVRFGHRKRFYEDLVVSAALLTERIKIAGLRFGPDNRAGIDGTLHRISRIMSRNHEVIGLTCRVGRPVPGCVRIIEDLVESGASILLLGAPGSGKTTKLRDVCRMASTDLDKAVVIVDTSNEIGGDGKVMHPAVGRARRLEVPDDRFQHMVMQEAVENHTPEVLVIDEIGNSDEALACRTFAQRGVQLIATAHGRTLEDVINNVALRDLVGGVKVVTLGDDMARQRGCQKTQQERATDPTFTYLVEIIDYNTVAVHKSVAESVDVLLRGGEVQPEIRVLTDDGWDVIKHPYVKQPARQNTGQRNRGGNRQFNRGKRRR